MGSPAAPEVPVAREPRRERRCSMSETGQVTSELLWRAAVIAALIDTPLLLLLGRGVPRELFTRLKWQLAAAAFIVYALLWGTLGSVLYWDAVYSAVFPRWFRWLLPVIYGSLYALLALLFWRLSGLARRWQVICFALLGGLVSIAGHAIGISRGLLRVPLLAEVSAASALVFGVFEFIFYWCVIVGLAVAARRVGLRGRMVREAGAHGS